MVFISTEQTYRVDLGLFEIVFEEKYSKDEYYFFKLY